MNVQRCKANKHFFDKDKYGEECPHCEKEKMLKLKEGDKSCMEEAVSNSQGEVKSIRKKPLRDWFSEHRLSEEREDVHSQRKEVKIEDKEEKRKDFKGKYEKVQNVRNSISADDKPTQSLAESIQQAKAGDGNQGRNTTVASREEEAGLRTGVPISKNNQDDVVTVNLLGSDICDPVVGWLVGIKGPYYGDSFVLHADSNLLGRHSKMDIALIRDGKVSREKHAIIRFDSKNSDFYLTPGEGKSNIYLNETIVLESVKMTPEDILEIGDTQLMLIPFAPKDFTWDWNR